MNVRSFDVFDTLLTRALGAPETVFSVLGRRLEERGLVAVPAATFTEARKRAEAQAREQRESGETTLAEIYALLAVDLELTTAQRDAVCAAELALEAELLRPVPEQVAAVQTARAAGDRIVYVSDMYLPSTFICEQLRTHGIYSDGDACYVSCEQDAGKWNGALFRKMLDAEGCAPRDVTHHGNAYGTEIQRAAELGMETVFVPEGNLNRYEQLLQSSSDTTRGLGSALAGASRLARLELPARNAHERAIRDVAAGVLAPALIGFGIWLLRRAQALGLRRLGFLSRDGQILYEVTKRLAARLGSDAELRYLYSSRKTWITACTTNVEPAQTDWIFEDLLFLSVTDLVGRLCLSPDDLREPLATLGLTPEHWTRNLEKDERLRLRRAVFEDARVAKRVLARAGALRPILLDYLRGEGMLDGAPEALVDLGWRASTQTALHRLLTTDEAADTDSRPLGAAHLWGLYFGLLAPKTNGDELAAEGYFFDERNGNGLLEHELPQLATLLEVLCVADHGMVQGFRRDGDSIEPLFASDPAASLHEWGLGVLRRTVYHCAETMVLDRTDVDLDADLRPTAHRLLCTFWYEPEPAEALTWGACPIVDRLGNLPFNSTVARPYRWRDVFATLRHGTINMPYGCAWFQGCFQQTPSALRLALKAANRVGSLPRTVLGRGRQPQPTDSADSSQQ